MLVGWFGASGIGATGLTVTVDVWRYRSAAWSQVVTSASATEIGNGGYGYLLSDTHIAAGDIFFGRFATAGTADQKNQPFSFDIEANYTSAKAGYITGDAYVRLGAPVGASISADIAAVKADTGALVTSVDALPTNAELATALDPIATAAEVTAATAPLATTADLTLVYNRLGAPAGASMSADVAAVKADTTSLLANITALPAAIWDRLLTSITTVGSIGKRIKDYLDVQLSTIPALTATALRAVVVTFRTPVESEGKINIRAGDDYTNNVYDRAFVWELTNLPELVGGTASLAVDGVNLTTAGTVTDGGVNGDGDTVQIVTVEVTAAQSALLVSDNWGQRKLFSVQITQGGELMTEISGTANVYPPHV